MTAARRGGKRIGYVRVSSVDQNTVRQLDGVQLDKVFTDKASGKDTNRPQLKAALDYLRDGDVLLVHSMDRLARNISDLLQTVATLNVGGVAEFERAMIRERQLEGIAKAKQAGKYTGRKSTMTATQVEAIRNRAVA